ncbi:MAG: pyruvate dehydrogenase (acetyl-transferring) E1 component subunit alpha [Bacteroidetes bacterium QH_8_67_23]|nr:MAG: pyruvate dehydrogenase (acetyl-transferring) E1 component subunit alpha [Bacteroidetes bacterium QH_8_67_23]
MAQNKSAKEKSAKEEAAEQKSAEVNDDGSNTNGRAQQGATRAGDANAEEAEAAADDVEDKASDEREAAGEGEDDDVPAPEEVKAASEVPGEPVTQELEFPTYPAESFTHDELGFEEDEVLAMYQNMLLQRRFEERCRQQYQQQNISGFLHLYIGQEAVSTGSVNAIRHGEDSVITAYRDHGLGLAMGLDPGACMAELFGKATGTTNGKGGSMHFFDREKRFFGGHGIVGAGVPLGAGIAFAHQYRGDEEVCLCFFGDGAVQQGAFHEAMNLAGLYDLPVVMICENNQYGMGTHIERAAANPDLYQHAHSYDLPGAVANGQDVFSVNKAVSDHVEMAREGQPSLLEVRTYRYQGHSISDPANYRAEGELEAQQANDAIIRLKKYILDEDLSDDDTLDEMDEEARQTVLDAIEFAEESDLPDESALYENVYAEEDYPFLA